MGGFAERGKIFANGDVGSFTVGGSVIGGSASSTGTSAVSGWQHHDRRQSDWRQRHRRGFGRVERISRPRDDGGSLIGGSGNSAGSIGTNEAIGAVTIRGDLVGGTDQRTGSIVSGGASGA